MTETYHAHHILLRHEYEALDMLRKLSQGTPFSELARKFSICSSAQRGGDLGILSRGRADPEFEQATLRLSPGEITRTPVRTRFGYHLILRHA